MNSFTVKGIPDELMDRLRAESEHHRRSINQQIITILDQVVPVEGRQGFASAYAEFISKWGPSPLTGDELDDVRDRGPSRNIDLW